MSPTRLLLALPAILLAGTAFGQAVPSREPSSTHIFPAGGRRGTTVTVRVGTECMPPGMRFTLQGDGVSAPPVLGDRASPHYEPDARRTPRDADGAGADMTYPREWASKITIAGDAVPGPRSWRVSGAFGGTRPRPFLVGDLPEFVETEPNSTPERAEKISLPVVVNGQVAGERDLDCFIFSAKEGDVVVFDVLAARIGSPLEPVVEITDSRGKRMERDEVRVGSDPVLAFRVPATGDYRVSVANVSYFGGPQYVYRMTVSTDPFVVAAFPSVGKAGERREVEMSVLTGTGTPRAVKERVAFPTTPGPFLLRGTIPLLATEEADLLEPDDNHSRAKAMELPPVASVNGRFLTAKEEDWFRFTAKKGEALTIRCVPFLATSAAMPVLTLTDAEGKALARASAVETPDRACEIGWTAPADGAWHLSLRDLQHGTRGGPELTYRLSLHPAHPDFVLRLEPDYVNVVQAGRTEVDLAVRRTAGFTGPIDLSADGLPDGVSIEPARVPEGQTRIKLALKAKEDTRPVDAVVRLHGKAVIAGKMVGHAATAASITGEGDGLSLTVQHRPMFRLTCSEAYQYAHRGTIYGYTMKLERLNGFTGPVTIQLCDRQVQDLDGIEIVEQVVPEGVTEFKNLIYLPETMHTSVQHHSRPYAQGYATFVDKWGDKQTILAVSEKRCMVRTLPTLVRLRATEEAMAAKPGGEAECKFTLDRTANFSEAMQLELLGPAGFKADAVRIDAGASSATVKVRMDRDVKGSQVLRFRATGKLESGEKVVTEARVLVKVD